MASLVPSSAMATTAATASVLPSTVSSAHSTTSPATKPRSCATCRSRKVKCDRLSPCTNCQRADIECVVPQADRVPRWARRLHHVTPLPGVVPQQQPLPQHLPQSSHTSTSTSISSTSPSPQVLERLRSLQSLVRELNVQLQQAHAANSSSGRVLTHDGTDFTSPAQSSILAQPLSRQQRDTSAGQSAPRADDQLRRLATRDAHMSRYISSNFWSRIRDEVS